MHIDLLCIVLWLYHQLRIAFCDSFTHILQGWVTAIGAIVWAVTYERKLSKENDFRLKICQQKCMENERAVFADIW